MTIQPIGILVLFILKPMKNDIVMAQLMPGPILWSPVST